MDWATGVGWGWAGRGTTRETLKSVQSLGSSLEFVQPAPLCLFPAVCHRLKCPPCPPCLPSSCHRFCPPTRARSGCQCGRPPPPPVTGSAPTPACPPCLRFSPLLELAVAANVAALRRLAKGGFAPPATYLTLLAQATEVTDRGEGVAAGKSWHTHWLMWVCCLSDAVGTRHNEERGMHERECRVGRAMRESDTVEGRIGAG